MNDYNQRNRQEYILNGNQSNKKINSNVYVQGNRQKVELDKKLEEISTKSDLIVSGNVISRNVLNSSASRRSTPSYIVDSEIYAEDENKKEIDPSKTLAYNINRGKEVMEGIKKTQEKQNDLLNKKGI